MAESLKDRVQRVIAGGLHALLDKIEDAAPEAMMEQSLREVEGVIDEVRAELGRATANRHLAQTQHSSLNAAHQKLAEDIEHALRVGREDLARAGIGRQMDIEAQLPVLEATLADYGRNEQELNGYLHALLAKKREMQQAVDQYRASRLEASTVAAGSPAASAAGARVEKAAGAFDRVFARNTGLTPASMQANLQQAAQLKELEDLRRNSEMEARLQALKGTLPGSSGE
jgi:phage shock protein A